MASIHPAALLGAAALLMSTSGCSDSVSAGEQVPDFSLVDENTTSATYQQSISPRDFIAQGSAWYFGHAT